MQPGRGAWRWSAAVALGLAMLLLSGGASSEPEPIAAPLYKYEPGRRYTYALTIQQEGSATAGAGGRAVATKLEGKLVLEAFEASDKQGVRLDLRLEELRYEGKVGDRPVDGGPFVGSLARQRGTWVVDASGATLHFLLKDTGNQRGQALYLVQDAVLKALPTFPAGALATGQRWEQGGEVKRTFQVLGEEVGALRLGITLQGAVSGGQVQGSGEAVFSRARGAVERLSTTTRFTASPGDAGHDLTLRVTLQLQ